jgi:hypothetical protein
MRNDRVHRRVGVHLFHGSNGLGMAPVFDAIAKPLWLAWIIVVLSYFVGASGLVTIIGRSACDIG